MSGHIVLVGFMGAGKTTVGARLAEQLKRPFVDIDTLVEAREGLSIREIFSKRGEDIFRTLEARTIADVIQGPAAVIATGGGALMNGHNLRRLKSEGMLFYLRGKPATLFARVGGDPNRPLMGQLSTLTSFADLLSKREPSYLKSDNIVDVDGLSVDEIVATILELLDTP